MTDEQLTRLGNVLRLAAMVGEQACAKWGSESQLRMAQEECGELVAAVAQYERDRVPGSDVVEECADVIITALQAGFICGGGQGCDFDPDDLIDALAAKTARLRLRIGGGR